MVQYITFSVGFILLLFPFVLVFSAWKMWLAFGLGLLLIIMSIHDLIAGTTKRKK